ncbi:MAG: glycosyltransferase [Myxococcota bacterium]|nr:glycosyltransferase [Myxococcota bacterium]
MKILQVVPYYEPDFHHGGVVRSTSILCRELVKLGHEVTVYTTQDWRSSEIQPEGVPIDIGGVKVVYFKNRLGGFGFGRDMLRATRNLDEFDIVHVAAFWQLFGLPAFSRARRAGIPTVLSPRGSLVMVRRTSADAFKHRLFYRLLNRRLLKSASAIHFTAGLERDDAEALGLETPSFCIPNAVPMEEFRSLPDRSEARRKLGLSDSAPLVLFVGRLDRRKALDVLLRAFSRLSGRGADAVLILAGPDFGELKMLEGLSKSLKMEARVQFLGMVDAEERASLLAAADLLTLTSLAENFGNSGTEAMAAGVAVLISDQCGVAEGVEESGVGRVVEVDEDAMVRALDEMLVDRETLRQMGARGPSFAESRYAAGKVGKNFALAYADILSGNRSAQCRWSDG